MSAPRRFRTILCWLCLITGSAGLTAAEHPGVVYREFTHTEDVGFGNSVFLVGDAEVLGSNAPEQGIKLRYTNGHVWRANVAVEGRADSLNYRFVSRSTSPDVYCDAANASDLSTGHSLDVASFEAAPHHGKTIHYLSGWASANLFYWSSSAEAFVEVAMTRIADGRVEGEHWYQISGIAEAGRPLTFAFNNGAGQWDNAFGQAGLNYETTLDFAFVQDGHVYNYRPANSVSAPRIESRTVLSDVDGIPDRRIQIYLPRGYDTHPDRRYPVLYMHDGQNVFSPGGAFGSWDADLTASSEIQMGRMRECILVAIDNSAERLSEYLAPSDDFNGSGRCDDYADFVINNVCPTIDVNYRSLNEPANTLLMGSSFGGIATVYMAWAHSDVFGKVGVLSPSWWAIPNLRNSMRDATARSQRVFLCWGTEESSGSADAATWWPPFLDGYDIYLSQGYHVGGDFLSVVGCGLAHNEAAWASQLATAFRFLLDINDAPNELSYLKKMPQLDIAMGSSTAGLSFSALAGYHYQLQTTDDLLDPESWQTLSTHTTPRYWTTLSINADIDVEDQKRFYRIQALSE